MDFEIEGDDDDYNFDWGNDSEPAAKKNSMFGGGGGYEEESEYNFSYENDRGTKKKYEAFSPQAVHSNAPVAKQNVVVANSGNALERAQNLMDKYSGKTVSAPSSNFRNQQIRTFSEADISLSEDEPSESEFEMSESIDDKPIGKKAGSKGGAKGKPVGKRDINALDSKAHVVVSMGDLGDSHSDDSDYLSEHAASTTGVEPPPRSLQRAPTFDDVSHGDEDDDEDEGEEPDENEYSNDEFDHDAGESYEESAEEIGESTQMSATVDTDVEVPNSYSHASKAPLGVQFAVRNGTSANFPSTTTNLASGGANANNSGNNNGNNSGATDNIKSITATATAPGASSFYTTSNTQSVFNSVRNRPPSPYSDHSDSTRPVSPDQEEESADMADRDHSIRSESPNENNASYSRLVYGNEDEQDSVSEYSGEESNNNINLNGTGGSRGSHGKPKVFSFADLLSQESWDADKHKEALPSATANTTNKASAVTVTTANTIANAVVNPLEVSELHDEFTNPVSKPVVYTAPTTTTTTAAAAMIGNKSAAATTMSVKPVALSEPTRSSSPPTNNSSAKSNIFNTVAVVPPAVVPSVIPAVVPQPTPATAQPPMQYPPYPYTYPPPPQPTSQAASTVDAQGQPLPTAGSAYFPPQYPTQYPPQYLYPYPYPPPPMASQMPPQYYPYPYPPSPYYPPPYAPYPAAPTPGRSGMSGMPGHSPPYVSAHPAGHAPHSAHTASYPPPYSYPDVRFSHDGSLNPLLHATTPTLQALESLTNPRGQSVSNRLSLSQSNQLYGSAYFDRDVAQQPLVVDLLQELRKSKEEAQWAKAKLAETIVRLGQQQQLSTTNNNNNMFSTNNKSVSSHVGNNNVEAGSAESKMNTPDKPKKHNAVSFLQDVISPVLPMRASLNTANSTINMSNMGGSKGNIANSRRNNLDDSELDEVPSEDESEEEEDEDDAASDYSDDFEDAASSPAPKNKGNSSNSSSGNSTSNNANTSNTISSNNSSSGGYSKPTTTSLSNSTVHTTTTATTTATATAPVYTGATLAEVKAAQEEASRGIRERERVLNPLKESLAYSLLASQELFKNQLESLRLRIGATNDYTNLLQQRVNSQWDELNTGTTGPPPSSSPLASTTTGTATGGSAFDTAADLGGTSFQPTPSLHHLRSSFEARRVASSEKLLDLLTQVYPNMTVEEATRLTAKI